MLPNWLWSFLPKWGFVQRKKVGRLSSNVRLLFKERRVGGYSGCKIFHTFLVVGGMNMKCKSLLLSQGGSKTISPLPTWKAQTHPYMDPYTWNGRNGKVKPDILAANKNKKTTIAFLWQLLDSRSTEMSKWKYTFLESNKGYWVVVYFTGVFCTTDTLTNFGARDIHKLLSLCACTLNMMC